MSSKTIDERIVSMKFDNADFKKKAKETINLLEEFKKKTDKAFKTTQKNMSSGWDGVLKSFEKLRKNIELKKETQNITKEIDGVGKSASKTFEKITNAAQNGWGSVTKAIEKVKNNLDMSREAFKVSDTFSNMASESTKSFNRMQDSFAEGWDPVIRSIDGVKYELNFSKETSKISDGFAQAFGDANKYAQKIDFSQSAESLRKLESAADNVTFEGLNKAVDEVSVKFGLLEVAAVNTMNTIVENAKNAGIQMARAFTGVDYIRDGLSEYELEIGSVQTIQAGTGKDIPEIMGYLDELNTYADKTIYSFSDMTSSIGKFTNAGVDLDKAVKAIQGVSNVAAVAGADTNAASRAMYNFAQALSSGSIRLIDWMSIENANMATVEFKNELIKSAVAAGTLQDNLDGTFTVLTENSQGSTLDEAIDAVHGFRDSLSYNWMTADVLVDTLNRYANEEEAIGKKAFAAATEVKTFSQLIDTLKEAMGTGWATTWRLVIGDFNEAKELWTGVNDVLSDMIGRQADVRNEMLKTWRNTGGRTAAIEGMKNAFEALLSVMRPIQKAFHNVFPPMTGEKLTEISIKFRDFMASLKLSDEGAEHLEKIATGLFSFVDILLHLPALISRGSGPLGTVIGKTLGLLGSIAEKVSDVVYKIDVALKEFVDKVPLTSFKESVTEAMNSLEEMTGVYAAFGGVDTSAIDDLAKRTEESFNPIRWIFETITELARAVKETVQGWGPYFKQVGEGLGKIFTGTGGILQETVTKIFDRFVEFLDSFTFEDFIRVISGLTLRGLLKDIRYTGLLDKQLRGDLEKTAKVIGEIGEGAIDIVNEFRDAIKLYEKQINAKILFTIAAAVGILALSMTMLSQIDQDALISSIWAIGAAFVLMMGSLFVMVKIMDSSDQKFKKIVAGIGQILVIAGALLLVASAARKLGELTWEAWIRGITGALLILSALLVVTKLLTDKAKVWPQRITTKLFGLIFMAEALRILVSSVSKLAKIEDPTLMAEAVFAVSELLVLVTMLSKILADEHFKGSNPAAGVKQMFGLVLMAESLHIVANSVYKLAQLDGDKMANATLVVEALLMTLVGLSKILAYGQTFQRGVIFTGVTAILLAKSIQMIAQAIVDMAAVDEDKLWTARATIIFTLATMGLVLKFLSTGKQSILGSIKTGFAITGLGNAIRAIAEAMLNISKIPEDQLENVTLSLIAIMGILTVFGGVLGNAKTKISTVAAIYVAADAMRDLAMAMLMIRDLNIDQVGIITLAFGSIITLMAGLTMLGKKALVGSIALSMFVAPAILNVAEAMNMLRGLTIEDLGGMMLSVLGVITTVMGLAMVAGSSAKAALLGSIALNVMAMALQPLANAIVTLAGMNMDQAVVALTAISGAVLILTGMMVVIGQSAKSAILGSLALLILGPFLILLANAFKTIAEIPAEKVSSILLLIIGTLTAAVAALGILGAMGPAVLIGAVAIAASAGALWLLGKALIVLGKGLKAVEGAMFPFFKMGAFLMDSFIELLKGFVKGVLKLFGIESPSKVFADIGDNVVLGFLQGLGEHAGHILLTFVKFIAGVFTFFTKVPGYMASHGVEFVKGLVGGVGSKADSFIDVVAYVVDLGLDALSNKFNDFVNMGRHLISGLEAGISNNGQGAVNAIGGVAQRVAQRALDSFQINSPSKVFYNMGLGLNEGWTEGLSYDFSSIATDGFNDSINEMYKSLDGGFSNPTITPVLDLSNIQSGMGDLDSIMSSFTSGTTFNLAGQARNQVDTSTYTRNQNGLSVNNSDVVSAISSLEGKVGGLQESISNMQMVMDTGALVGQIAGPMDNALGFRTKMSGRGV